MWLFSLTVWLNFHRSITCLLKLLNPTVMYYNKEISLLFIAQAARPAYNYTGSAVECYECSTVTDGAKCEDPVDTSAIPLVTCPSGVCLKYIQNGKHWFMYRTSGIYCEDSNLLGKLRKFAYRFTISKVFTTNWNSFTILDREVLYNRNFQLVHNRLKNRYWGLFIPLPWHHIGPIKVMSTS